MRFLSVRIHQYWISRKILILPHLKFAPFFQEKPRTVISGLVKFIPEAEMQNRKAILMCNLKPSKMRGIMSEAMVMCASTPEKVEILTPPGKCVFSYRYNTSK